MATANTTNNPDGTVVKCEVVHHLTAICPHCLAWNERKKYYQIRMYWLFCDVCGESFKLDTGEIK